MNALIAKLLGIAKVLLEFVKPFLKSSLGRFLADPRTRELAVKAVENAWGKDLDGDGKFEYAARELAEELKVIGLAAAFGRTDIPVGWVATAIQIAYDVVDAKKKADAEE